MLPRKLPSKATPAVPLSKVTVVDGFLIFARRKAAERSFGTHTYDRWMFVALREAILCRLASEDGARVLIPGSS